MTEIKKIKELCKEILKEKNKVLIAINGLPGSGKSTIGKKIRKNGFGDFKPYQIAVVDDDVMSLNLFIARPKIKFKRSTKHNKLKIFLKYLPKFIKIVFYINTNFIKFNKADILLTIKTDEQTREKRLRKRENDLKKVKFFMQTSLHENLTFEHKITVNT